MEIAAIVLSALTLILVRVKKSNCGTSSCETREQDAEVLDPDTPVNKKNQARRNRRKKHNDPHRAEEEQVPVPYNISTV